jgi:hypothetical protein
MRREAMTCGVDSVTPPSESSLTPARAPNANAYAERFVRSIKEECLDRQCSARGRHFLRAVTEYVSTTTPNGITRDSDDESCAASSAARRPDPRRAFQTVAATNIVCAGTVPARGPT